MPAPYPGIRIPDPTIMIPSPDLIVTPDAAVLIPDIAILNPGPTDDPSLVVPHVGHPSLYSDILSNVSFYIYAG